MANVLETLAVKLVGDVSDYEQKMKGASSTLDSTASKMKSVGGALTSSVTLPLLGIGAAAVAMSTQFNAGMANVASLGLLPERVLELKGNVQELAVATGKSTSDMADGLYQVVSAFGDTSDTAAILEINAKAAAAGLATTTDAINLTSAVTKGYGDTSEAAVQKAADLAFQTVKLGQTDFPELAASIGKVVPLAASLGVAQEDLFGVMATATGVTGGAAEVATQLRGVLQSLMAPTGDMTTLISDMGFSSGQAMLEQLGLQGTINAMVKAAEDSGKPLQSYISSIEGQTLALALAGPQADVFTEKLAAMSDTSGVLDKAFADQTEGINKTGFTMAQAAVKGQVLLQKLGDGLAPALSKVLDLATPWIDKLIQMADWFANADGGTQTWIVSIVALVAAAGPVIGIIGTVISVVSTVIGVISAASGVIGVLGGALAILTGPIGIIIAAIALLTLAWTTDFLGIKTATLGVIDNIKAAWPGWIDGMKTGWSNFTSSVSSGASGLWENVKGFFQTGGQAVAAVTQGQLSTVQQLWQAHVQTTQGVVQAGMQFLRGDWEGGLNTLQETARTLMDNIRGIFQTQLDMVRNLFDIFGWGDIGNSIIQGIADGINAGVTWIVDAARNAAQAALNAAKSWLGIGSPSKEMALQIGEPMAQGVGVGFEDEVGRVTRNIGQTLNRMVGGIQPSYAGAGAGGGNTINIDIYLQGGASYEDGRNVGRGISDELHARGLA